jgi:hypothetical protein
MPKYIIERNIPGVGSLPPEELQSISARSCSIIRNLQQPVQWLESFVTADKLYCVYIANDEASVRLHAAQGNFPVDRVSQVLNVIDPTTAEKDGP